MPGEMYAQLILNLRRHHGPSLWSRFDTVVSICFGFPKAYKVMSTSTDWPEFARYCDEIVSFARLNTKEKDRVVETFMGAAIENAAFKLLPHIVVANDRDIEQWKGGVSYPFATLKVVMVHVLLLGKLSK
jgi:hypothetical protein